MSGTLADPLAETTSAGPVKDIIGTIVGSAYEALREKTELLGGLHEILLKFHILKVEFLYEKILFFSQFFFTPKYGWPPWIPHVYTAPY